MSRPPTTERADWFGGLHWSYDLVAWFGAFRALPNGQFLLRHELTWNRVVPEMAAMDIVALWDRRNLRKHWRGTWAQAALFPKPGDRGEFPSETFSRSGVHLSRGARNVPIALARLRSWFEPIPFPNHETLPTLIVHPDCPYFIRSIPALEASIEVSGDDVREVPEMIPALGASYFVMARPMRTADSAPKYPKGAIGWDVDELRRQAKASV